MIHAMIEQKPQTRVVIHNTHFTRSWRSAQESPLWDFGPELFERLWVLQKVHKLHDFLLGFLASSYTTEVNLDIFFGYLLGGGLSNLKNATHAPFGSSAAASCWQASPTSGKAHHTKQQSRQYQTRYGSQ
jgi:hypothetical protein